MDALHPGTGKIIQGISEELGQGFLAVQIVIPTITRPGFDKGISLEP